jgi:hypothetical protein
MPLVQLLVTPSEVVVRSALGFMLGVCCVVPTSLSCALVFPHRVVVPGDFSFMGRDGLFVFKEMGLVLV